MAYGSPESCRACVVTSSNWVTVNDRTQYYILFSSSSTIWQYRQIIISVTEQFQPASTTVHAHLCGSFLLVRHCIYQCIHVLYIIRSATGYVQLFWGLKKLVWSWMLQCGSGGSRNQSKIIRQLTTGYELLKIFYYVIKCGRNSLWSCIRIILRLNFLSTQNGYSMLSLVFYHVYWSQKKTHKNRWFSDEFHNSKSIS